MPSLTHAPFTLAPSPFPRTEFDKALRIQKSIDRMVHNISMDFKFVQDTLKGYVCQKPKQYRTYMPRCTLSRVYVCLPNAKEHQITSRVCMPPKGLKRSTYVTHWTLKTHAPSPESRAVRDTTHTHSPTIACFLVLLAIPELRRRTTSRGTCCTSTARCTRREWFRYVSPLRLYVVYAGRNYMHSPCLKWLVFCCRCFTTASP